MNPLMGKRIGHIIMVTGIAVLLVYSSLKYIEILMAALGMVITGLSCLAVTWHCDNCGRPLPRGQVQKCPQCGKPVNEMRVSRKYLMTPLAVVIVTIVTVLISSARGWISTDQQVMDYLNNDYRFPQGNVAECTYLQSGKDGSGEHVRYLIRFSNGQKKLIRLNVLMHPHLIQRGPDYRILSVEDSYYEAPTCGEYTSNKGKITLIINEDCFWISYADSASEAQLGTWRVNEGVLILSMETDQFEYLYDSALIVSLSDDTVFYLKQ